MLTYLYFLCLDSADEVRKHPTGVIEDADEGKIMFGDYSLTYDGEMLVEKQETLKIDGGKKAL